MRNAAFCGGEWSNSMISSGCLLVNLHSNTGRWNCWRRILMENITSSWATITAAFNVDRESSEFARVSRTHRVHAIAYSDKHTESDTRFE